MTTLQTCGILKIWHYKHIKISIKDTTQIWHFKLSICVCHLFVDSLKKNSKIHSRGII
jgi:hypothetical protein